MGKNLFQYIITRNACKFIVFKKNCRTAKAQGFRSVKIPAFPQSGVLKYFPK